MKRVLGYQPLVKAALRKYIRSQKAAHASENWSDDFFKRLMPYTGGGKLLRGCLVCFSYEVFSGQEANEPVIDTAVAIELAHSALLTHDDIMDNDDLRRGYPSLHRQYQQLASRRGLSNPERLGVSLGLCAGDATLFLAFRQLAQLTTSPGIQSKVFRLFVNYMTETCFGQMRDIAAEASPDTPTKKDIINLMAAKTAGYTLALPLALGATLAEASPASVKELQAIGIAAGTIFQIRDDELGVMGNPKQTGKPVGADIREDKRTLLYYYLHRQCSPYEQQWLREIFGNPDVSDRDVADIRRLIRRHGIIGLLDQDVAVLEKKAIAGIEKLPLSRAHKTEFRSLIKFCSQRQL